MTNNSNKKKIILASVGAAVAFAGATVAGVGYKWYSDSKTQSTTTAPITANTNGLDNSGAAQVTSRSTGGSSNPTKTDAQPNGPPNPGVNGVAIDNTDTSGKAEKKPKKADGTNKNDGKPEEHPSNPTNSSEHEDHNPSVAPIGTNTEPTTGDKNKKIDGNPQVHANETKGHGKTGQTSNTGSNAATSIGAEIQNNPAPVQNEVPATNPAPTENFVQENTTPPSTHHAVNSAPSTGIESKMNHNGEQNTDTSSGTKSKKVEESPPVPTDQTKPAAVSKKNGKKRDQKKKDKSGESTDDTANTGSSISTTAHVPTGGHAEVPTERNPTHEEAQNNGSATDKNTEVHSHKNESGKTGSATSETNTAGHGPNPIVEPPKTTNTEKHVVDEHKNKQENNPSAVDTSTAPVTETICTDSNSKLSEETNHQHSEVDTTKAPLIDHVLIVTETPKTGEIVHESDKDTTKNPDNPINVHNSSKNDADTQIKDKTKKPEEPVHTDNTAIIHPVAGETTDSSADSKNTKHDEPVEKKDEKATDKTVHTSATTSEADTLADTKGKKREKPSGENIVSKATDTSATSAANHQDESQNAANTLSATGNTKKKNKNPKNKKGKKASNENNPSDDAAMVTKVEVADTSAHVKSKKPEGPETKPEENPANDPQNPAGAPETQSDDKNKHTDHSEHASKVTSTVTVDHSADEKNKGRNVPEIMPDDHSPNPATHKADNHETIEDASKKPDEPAENGAHQPNATPTAPKNGENPKPDDVPEPAPAPKVEVKNILDPETVMNADFKVFDNDNYRFKKLKTDTAAAVIIGTRVSGSDPLFNKDAGVGSVEEELKGFWKKVFFVKDRHVTFRYKLMVLGKPASGWLSSSTYPFDEADLGPFIHVVRENAAGLFGNSPNVAIKELFRSWTAKKAFKDEGKFILIREDVAMLPESERKRPHILELVAPKQVVSTEGYVADVDAYKIDHLFGKENLVGHLLRISSVDRTYPQPDDFASRNLYTSGGQAVDDNGKLFKILVKSRKEIDEDALKELSKAAAKLVHAGKINETNLGDFLKSSYNNKAGLNWFIFESSFLYGTKIDGSILVFPSDAPGQGR